MTSIIKRLALPLLVCVAATAVASAQGDQAELVKKRDDKLKAEFFKKATWITDFDQAKAEAKKSGKLIFAYFTRSYAH